MDFLQPPRRFGLGTFVHDPDIDWPGWFSPRPISKDLPGWFSPRPISEDLPG